MIWLLILLMAHPCPLRPIASRIAYFTVREPTHKQTEREAYFMWTRGEGKNDIDRFYQAKERLTVRAKMWIFEVKGTDKEA